MGNTQYKNIQAISFLTFTLIVLSFNVKYSQTLKLYWGSGYQYHLEGTKSHGYVLPFFDRHTLPTNSINEFFNSSLHFNLGISYKFDKEIASNLVLGLDLERSILSSKYDEVDLILGKDLTMNIISPYVGFGKVLNINGTVNLIGSLGFAVALAKGKAERDRIKFTYNYEPEILIRFGIKLEVEINSNFEFALGIKGFIGNQTRDKVDIKYNGISTYLIPIGSKHLQDNIVSPFINFQYRIVL